MSNDDTFIEQPSPGNQPPKPGYEPPPELPPLPPMPPPPEPSGRNWVPLAIVMGLLIVVLCGIAAFGIYRLIQGGVLTPGLDDTEIPDIAGSQTALVEEVTDVVLFTETATLQPSATLEPTAAPATLTTAPTSVPSDTAIPTPSEATFTASQAIFCRSGPSTIYPERRTMQDGQTLPILGKSVSPVDNVSVWYLVEIEGAQCFVSSGLGTVEGDLTDVPTIPAPPTPTPTPTPTATPTPTPTP
jgi:hypothetical protein